MNDKPRSLSTLSTFINKKMTAKRFYFILLIVMALFQSCANDNKKTAQAPSPETAAAPAPTQQEAAAPVEQPQEKKESPVGKSVEQLRENKTNRIGSVPMGKDAELSQSSVAPPPITPIKKSAPAPGPTAYTNKANVILQSEPSKDSPKTRSFKIYEQVFILETKMTDDAGYTTQFPTWYRVQCSDKKEGWVVANSITLN